MAQWDHICFVPGFRLLFLQQPVWQNCPPAHWPRCRYGPEFSTMLCQYPCSLEIWCTWWYHFGAWLICQNCLWCVHSGPAVCVDENYFELEMGIFMDKLESKVYCFHIPMKASWSLCNRLIDNNWVSLWCLLVDDCGTATGPGVLKGRAISENWQSVCRKAPNMLLHWFCSEYLLLLCAVSSAA